MPASGSRPAPAWLITHSYEDHDAGVLKSGKEAEVFIVERRSAAGSCLLAHKRYRPRYPGRGQLRQLGFTKGTIYRADAVYREGWSLNRRDRLAIDDGSRFGHKLSAAIWPHNEMQMLQRAYQAGASVPYPVERTDDGILMEFIGGMSGAAPRLVNASLTKPEAEDAWGQLLTSLRAMTAAGIVHGDLSAYNVLWWRGRAVIIDFPQAVEATTNLASPELLHRDVTNVARWFERRRVDVDSEGVFGDLLAVLYGG